MHAFFLGPNCKALEQVRFLPADVGKSSSVAEVDIEREQNTRDNARDWDASHKGQSWPLK